MNLTMFSPLIMALILCNLYKKFVYQVGINKGIILRCTAYQISRLVVGVRKYVYESASSVRYGGNFWQSGGQLAFQAKLRSVELDSTEYARMFSANLFRFQLMTT